MKEYNIVWVFVDSVRRYHSNDDRSRLPFMDEFASSSIELLNTVTSAPSTYMSISAMMTGWNSYFLSRNFNDFSFDSSQFHSLPNILKKHGYLNYNFWMHPMSRAFMNGILPNVKSKFWTSDLKRSEYWDNRNIFNLVQNTISNLSTTKSPKFFFVDFNCREDKKTDYYVKETFNLFDNAGYTDDNTIKILCSDHGYPDSSKAEGNPTYYSKLGLSHDLILTDDNIMIPFLLKYPSCPQGIKIKDTIGTIDILPTILDILEIENSDLSLAHGKSFHSLIKDRNTSNQSLNERFIRCDSRFSMQTGRGTAIRGSKYKYIFYHDDLRGKGNEEFFDISNDPDETENLIFDSKYHKELNIFRNKLKESEDEAYQFQINYLFQKLPKKHFKKIQKARNLIVTDSSNPVFSSMLLTLCKRINPKIHVGILLCENGLENFNAFDAIIDSGSESWSEVSIRKVKGIIQKEEIDLAIIPVNSSEIVNNEAVKGIFGNISKKKVIWIDYNLNMPSGLKHVLTLTIFRRWVKLLTTNPMIMLKTFLNKLNRV
jgi:hypothetical protein